jgi:K+-sensing histidine kinase KdpD
MMAVLATVLTVLAFFFSPSGGEFWKVLSNRALALFVIWVTAILGQQLKVAVRKQREATIEKGIALEELHTLRGLLPICSHCKNIRDEMGNWIQLERYIDKHSDAEFSHGVCPDCAAKYYPGIKYTSSE